MNRHVTDPQPFGYFLFGVGVSTGRIYSLARESGYDYQEGAEYAKVLLRRFDGSGNLAWAEEVDASYCGEYYDDCLSLAPESLEVNSQGYAFAMYSPVVHGVGDCGSEISYYVAKMDATGQRVGLTRLPSDGWGPSEEVSFFTVTPSAGMAVDGNGNVYVAQQKADFVEDYCSATRSNIVSKYSPTGTLLWQRSSTVGLPTDVAISSSGSVYVVGTRGMARYSSTGGLNWTKTGSFQDVVISGSNLYTRYNKDIRKYDSTGKQLWLKSQSGLNGLVLQAIDGDGSGNVYLSGKYKTPAGDSSAMVRKLSSSGSVLWTRTYGTSAYDDALGIATITGSEIYTTGETQGSLAHTNIGGRDGYLRKFSSTGGTVWTR